MVRTSSEEPGDFLLYDGECPFCARYVRMQRLREAGVSLQLVDARSRPDLVAAFAREGYDINDGMILRLGGETHFGGDVMHVLALMTGPSGPLNRIVRRLFANGRLARAAYPFLRTGRNATLRLLGKRIIDVSSGA